MKSIEKISFFLLPLSILFSSLTFIPNRILVISLLLIILFRNDFFINILSKKKWLIFIGILYVLLILFGNPYLSKEAILFLTLPIYPLLYRQCSLNKFLLKKYFILAVFAYSIILLLVKSIKIISFGFSNFIEQEQWWNQILYKNLSVELSAHPTYIAMFIIASFVMLLDQNLQAKKYFSSFKYVFIQTVLLLVLILLVVKISFFAIILILMTYMVFLLINNQIKTVVMGMLFLLITGIAAYHIPGVKHRLLVDFKSIQNLQANSSGKNRLQERAALWKASFNYIKQHPLIGSSFHGISSSNSIYPEAKTIYPQLEYPKNSHNNFLEFGVRYGILGTVLFSLFIILFLGGGLKQASFEIIGLWILICLFSLTESFIFREQGMSLVAILIAIFGIQLYGRDI